ncbi:hypothetical protein TH66_00245 [Carbonactinospora thermoautotrophica]|uniref:Uncharacterized protein n=1 Tax=Carbonactinospora thermoautotrophica TaxID=1469144 RepID=A0A132N3U5_9ACTN|nr:hypothetical protein [Carbonactinospora thermoautotrophica]KWX04620.1 hypothetical protein TR74_24150 [Carbonactinospora thermoautotrophica]KWX05980.1 hypothetical protein TH66_00245 [Carbonactinospora thermoautotrophica]
MDLFTLVVLMWVARLTATDIAYAVRGKTPPRVKLRIARMQAEAVAAGQRPCRYGARDYFVDLWHDAWEDARAAREERRAKKQAAKRAELATVTVEPAKADEPAKPAEAKTPAEPQPVDTPAPAPATAKPQAAPAPQRAGETKPPADPEPAAEPATEPAKTPEPAPTPQPAAVAGPQTPATGQSPAPETAPADGPLATVTPIHRIKEDTVTVINGETHTLAAAKQYAAEMTRAAGAAVTSIEQSIAHLQAREVTGPVLDRLAEAQDIASQLQAKFIEVSNALSAQDVVAEAYAAAPHAGDKQFLTQE